MNSAQKRRIAMIAAAIIAVAFMAYLLLYMTFEASTTEWQSHYWGLLTLLWSCFGFVGVFSLIVSTEMNWEDLE